QTAQAFGTLHDNLSFFRDAYDTFAGYRAVLDRLSGFVQNIRAADKLPVPDVKAEQETVALRGVSITTPAGKCLVKDLSFAVESGHSLLLQGPSGAGKTTILRTIAGLWPYSQGQVVRPDNNVLFLSQKPYLPEGSLLDVLYYPNEVPEDGHEHASKVLQDVNLG